MQQNYRISELKQLSIQKANSPTIVSEVIVQRESSNEDLQLRSQVTFDKNSGKVPTAVRLDQNQSQLEAKPQQTTSSVIAIKKIPTSLIATEIKEIDNDETPGRNVNKFSKTNAMGFKPDDGTQKTSLGLEVKPQSFGDAT